MKIMASGPITSWERDGETVETVSDFILPHTTANTLDVHGDLTRRQGFKPRGATYHSKHA